MTWQLIPIFFIILICIVIDGQTNGVAESVDPTSQDFTTNESIHLVTSDQYSIILVNIARLMRKKLAELALLDWSSGIRIFYCTDGPLEVLVEPFKRAIVQSLNKFCRNATACRLVKSFCN
uniref:Secreted protein n=1 Tax=Elaeophora elaphi TaxID=1147741 RepID=A0A0R3RYH4_9BILA